MWWRYFLCALNASYSSLLPTSQNRIVEHMWVPSIEFSNSCKNLSSVLPSSFLTFSQIWDKIQMRMKPIFEYPKLHIHVDHKNKLYLTLQLWGNFWELISNCRVLKAMNNKLIGISCFDRVCCVAYSMAQWPMAALRQWSMCSSYSFWFSSCPVLRHIRLTNLPPLLWLLQWLCRSLLGGDHGKGTLEFYSSQV